jgi:hypothetical protein
VVWHGAAVESPPAVEPDGGPWPADPSDHVLAAIAGEPVGPAPFFADDPTPGEPEEEPDRSGWRPGRLLFLTGVGLSTGVFVYRAAATYRTRSDYDLLGDPWFG